jgi:beta-lactamase class A
MKAREGRARGIVHGLLLALLTLCSMGVGYFVRGMRQPQSAAPQSYEIRGDTGGLTNPLLDCEMAEYRRGRELRPFKREIEALVDRLISEHAAERISLYFRDLDNGPSFGIRSGEAFTGASLLKVPTIMAALLEAQDNAAFLARMVRFEGSAAERSLGEYVPEQALVPGAVYSVDDLLRRAAAYSDNAAVGVINRIVDPAYLARVYYDLDVPQPPPDQPGARSISPASYGRLFRVLYNASYLTRPLSERALGYFVNSAFHEGLEAGVPPGTTVSHKFGIYSIPGRTLTAQLHDCGIVYLPGRPYFLCVMTEGRDADTLAAAIGQISREVYRAVDAHSLSPGQSSRSRSGSGADADG